MDLSQFIRRKISGNLTIRDVKLVFFIPAVKASSSLHSICMKHSGHAKIFSVMRNNILKHELKVRFVLLCSGVFSRTVYGEHVLKVGFFVE